MKKTVYELLEEVTPVKSEIYTKSQMCEGCGERSTVNDNFLCDDCNASMYEAYMDEEPSDEEIEEMAKYYEAERKA